MLKWDHREPLPAAEGTHAWDLHSPCSVIIIIIIIENK